MIAALITNKNNPKVTMVTGNVSITNIGFSTAFKIAKSTATMSALT